MKELAKNNLIITMIKQAKYSQFFYFGSVGVFNTLIDFAVFNSLIFLFGIGVGWSYIVFRSISFLGAATNSYFMNKYITFQSSDAVHVIQVGKFVTVTLVAFFANVVVGYTIFSFSSKDSHINLVLLANISNALGIIASMGLNFFGYKFFVFKK